MAAPLTKLHEAVSAIDAAWSDADELPRHALISLNAAIGSAKRVLDAMQARIAAEIAHESRPELGPDSLAKQQGFRSPAQLIAATTGVSAGDAARLVQVGEAVAPRTDLVGDPMPARYPAVQDALAAGDLAAQSAALIIAFLDRARVGVDRDLVADTERRLVERAVGLSLDDVRRLVKRAEAVLEADRLEHREEERRGQRTVAMFERDGMFHLNLVTPVEEGAPIRTAVDAYVTAQFQARKDALDAGGVDADQRTVAMMRADALSVVCAHVLGCESERMPMAGATVIVRVDAADLEAGTGAGTIDGFDQPISITAVRRMAAGAGVIPCVLDSAGDILDWGRERRFFSKTQKLALAERDGGCAMCGLPPSMTKAHHIRWWTRDRGPTDLANGVLLCETCHHRIHDNGWDIRIDGTGTKGRVWFIPPPSVDPARAPRLGGRARYDIAA
ncbi:HNH endonuclease signature motif containing protein [Microbacterium sp. YJN-G]|uniref:HNH endonuclease signature motif containing protein n=1 Tax=Microbacterium sp. YJN-G TaxID=2763257 RepID=UPI00187784DE|nr:HNH endonuclease signature motif containing protein [Microbacterium sp. YJN-G]